jgi:LmbE family N-acetylglucosaminyl deacetylase
MRRSFGNRGLLLSSVLIFAVFLFSCEQPPSPKRYFPEIGKNALFQRSLELRSNLNVLSIAIQPGYEDLSALAYFRLGRGATIKSAYITNGEAGESDVQAEYPPYLADIRRREASNALSYLDGQVHFLNMPDIAAARDSAKVRELWQSTTLQAKLIELFLQFKPDIIMVTRDWITNGKNPGWEVLYSDVMAAVKKTAPVDPNKKLIGPDAHQSWNVDRVVVDDGAKKDIFIPVDKRHPRWKKTYHEIGEEAARSYHSLAIQRRLRLRNSKPSYFLAYSLVPPSVSEVDAGLPRPSTPRLLGIEQQIRQFTNSTRQGKKEGALEQLVAIMDSVNYYLARRYKLQQREIKSLLHWKKGLEDLHCTLLGVEVEFSISDTALTERQLTFLTVNKVKGTTEKGYTKILFAGLDGGWAINEDVEHELPLDLNEKYRLLSPGRLDYAFPPGLQEFHAPTVGKPFSFYILHHTPTKEQSFVHRTTTELFFGPRFITEILTPVVRMVPNERVIFRLTNLSRDGVADTIKIENPVASSTESVFRLSTKESSHLDTLFISWKGNPGDGTHLIPVLIDGITVANFAARKFHTEVDTSKKIGIIKGLRHSSIEDALRRLNVEFSIIDLDQKILPQIDSLDVIIIDRRVLTLKPQIMNYKNELSNFVTKGGHLIVLAQDADSWNKNPLWDGMQLTGTFLFDENTPIQVDSSHTLISSPNMITSSDWKDWLFLRGYHIISGTALEQAELPIKVKPQGDPLVVTLTAGNGKRTYVDLALSHQWMNIHPGAFRLLANLISY